jgi:hypothetical protein
MRWYRKLYLGELAKKKGLKKFRFIRQGRFDAFTMVIALTDDENLLQMFPAWQLKWPGWERERKKLYVVGLAEGRKEAIGLISDILLDCFNATGEFDVGAYLGFGPGKAAVSAAGVAPGNEGREDV